MDTNAETFNLCLLCLTLVSALNKNKTGQQLSFAPIGKVELLGAVVLQVGLCRIAALSGVEKGGKDAEDVESRLTKDVDGACGSCQRDRTDVPVMP